MPRFIALFFLSILALVTVVQRSAERVGAAPASDATNSWIEVQKQLPSGVLALRPTWLPERFSQGPSVDFVHLTDPDIGPSYMMRYVDPEGGLLLFVLGASDYGDTRKDPMKVRGYDGLFLATDGWPQAQVIWTEGQHDGRPLTYGIQANTLTRTEMNQVAAGLVAARDNATTPPLPPNATAISEHELQTGINTWDGIRQKIPADVVVLRPTWLPARFGHVPWVQYVYDDSFLSGPSYLVEYGDEAGDQAWFALGSLNSCDCPTSESHVQVRGHDAFLTTTSGWPDIEIAWQEGGARKGELLPHQIQGKGVTRAELEKIVASLTPVTAGSKVSHLPQTGGLPIGLGGLASIGVLLLGAGLASRR